MSIKVEYSSGKNKCKTCNNKFDKQQLQIGPVVKGNTQWNHLDCWKYPSNYTEGTTITGMESINEADQEKVKKYMSDEANRMKAPKVLLQNKSNPTEREATIANLSKQIQKKFNLKELQKCMEANGQVAEPKASKSALCEKIAMGMLEGAIPKCPQCQKCNLEINGEEVMCPGNETDPSCGYKKNVKEIERPSWKFVETKDKELFDKFMSEKTGTQEKKTHEISLEEPETKKPKVE